MLLITWEGLRIAGPQYEDNYTGVSWRAGRAGCTLRTMASQCVAVRAMTCVICVRMVDIMSKEASGLPLRTAAIRMSKIMIIRAARLTTQRAEGVTRLEYGHW